MRLALKAVASACAFCNTLEADRIASAALWVAAEMALAKEAPMELVTLAMSRPAFWETERIASEMARSALC